MLLLDVGVAPVLSDDAEVTATIPPLADPVRVCANRFGVVPEPLADGSILIAFRGAGAEQTARAAKCALAIAEAMPRCLGVLGTGRALVHTGVPVGDLVDRVASLRANATMLHTGATASRIVVDGVSATLLEERFALAVEGGLQILHGERDAGDPVRTLLGKPSPCVGRERELAQLEAAFEECVDEDAPRAVLLTAPSGLGKSRVRFELLAKIKGRAQIWTGRGDPMSAGAPLDLVTQAIRRAYGLRADDAPEVQAREARHPRRASRHRNRSRVRDGVHRRGRRSSERDAEPSRSRGARRSGAHGRPDSRAPSARSCARRQRRIRWCSCSRICTGATSRR